MFYDELQLDDDITLMWSLDSKKARMNMQVFAVVWKMVLSDDWCLFFERDPDTNLEIQQRAVCRFLPVNLCKNLRQNKCLVSLVRERSDNADDSIICTSRLLGKRWLIQFGENVSDFYKTADEKLIFKLCTFWCNFWGFRFFFLLLIAFSAFQSQFN